jgi:proliferating cell nuclear antigen
MELPEVIAAADVPPPLPPSYQHMALHLKTIQGGAIRTLFEVLKEIVHDVRLRFDSTGVRLLTMDGSKCSCVYLKLRAREFDEYWCPDPVEAGVNMAKMFTLIRSANSRDVVTMYMASRHDDRLGLTIQNADNNIVTNFKLKLMDVDHAEINIKDVEYDYIITMSSAKFQKLCRDMASIHDTMTIVSEGNKLVLACNGDCAEQETVLGPADNMTFESSTDDKVEGKFSLKFLTLFCKATNLCTTVNLFIKQSFLLILQYQVASLGEIRFCLAPMIDDDET